MSLVIPLWGIYLMIKKKKKPQRKKTVIYNSRITKQELIHYPKKKKLNIYTNYNIPLWLWDQNDNDFLSQDGKCRCHCIKL